MNIVNVMLGLKGFSGISSGGLDQGSDKVTAFSKEFQITNPLPDEAMIGLGAPRGGIDLTPSNNILQTQNAGQQIMFHIDAAQIAQLQNAPGFVPVIINIRPLRDLRAFLELPSDASPA